MRLSRYLGSLSTRAGRCRPARARFGLIESRRDAASAAIGHPPVEPVGSGWAVRRYTGDRTRMPPAYASGVRPPARCDQIAQPLRLGAERVAAGRLHLTVSDHAALQRPAAWRRQDVVVGLERRLGARRRGRAVPAGRPVRGPRRRDRSNRAARARSSARVPGRAVCARGARSRPRQLGVVGQAIGEQHGVADGHPLPVGHPARPAHRADDRDRLDRRKAVREKTRTSSSSCSTMSSTHPPGRVGERGPELDQAGVFPHPGDEDSAEVHVRPACRRRGGWRRSASCPG